jgi:Fe-S oxidoreductase
LEPIKPNKMDAEFREKILARMGQDLKRCLSCGTCSAGCALREVDKNYNPRQIVRRVLFGMKDYFKQKPDLAYACNICGLCKQNCPYRLNLGELSLALREMLVDEGVGPLPKHKSIEEEKAFVNADSYTISLPDPDATECKRVFFPGCNLSAYSPSLTIATWDYLRKKLPGTGIILKCCGALAYDLGQSSQFQQSKEDLENEMRKLGASELITGCPECYHTIKGSSPNFKLNSLYEVMVAAGLPDGTPKGNGQTFNLHDSCKARWEKGIQESVRELITRMGYNIEEMGYSKELTRCCGQGGLGIGINPFRVLNLIKLRLTESHHDMLTYCAACRDAFAMHKPSLHILDLIFNPNWEKDKARPVNKVAVRRENQASVKSQLLARQKPKAERGQQ